MMLRSIVVLAALRSSVQGAGLQEGEDCVPEFGDIEVVARGDSNYDQATMQFASRMASTEISKERLHPEYIFFCKKDQDVIAAVKFANHCQYKVSIRSGGHQYAGLSSCVKGTRCLQIDVSGLETFTHHGDNRITLGVGLTLAQVVGEIAPLGLAIPTGVCSTIGVGGHFQSSSLGFLARSFGLGMDHVVSFRLVTAEGLIRNVTSSSDPDLYWAVLGSSPGSWGVVLDYTFDAIYASDHPHTQMFFYVWPYSHDFFVNFTNKYLEIVADPAVARDLSMMMAVEPVPLGGQAPYPKPGNTTYNHYINVIGFWSGIDNGNLTDALFDKHVQPMLSFQPPLGGYNIPMDLATFTKNAQIHYDYTPFRFHVAMMSTNDFFNADFVEQAATEIDRRIATPNVFSSFHFVPFGGGQVKRNKGKNSFADRDMGVHIDDWVFFGDDELNDFAQNSVEDFRTAMSGHWTSHHNGGVSKTWMTTGTTTDHADPDRFADFFPSQEWFDRLRDIKTSVDAEDLFSTPMTIPIQPPEMSRSSTFSMGIFDLCVLLVGAGIPLSMG